MPIAAEVGKRTAIFVFNLWFYLLLLVATQIYRALPRSAPKQAAHLLSAMKPPTAYKVNERRRSGRKGRHVQQTRNARTGAQRTEHRPLARGAKGAASDAVASRMARPAGGPAVKRKAGKRKGDEVKNHAASILVR